MKAAIGAQLVADTGEGSGRPSACPALGENQIVAIDNYAEIVASSNIGHPGRYTSNMKSSSFLTTLRAHASLPLVFRAGRDVVSPGYHLTEVKRVAYETMDCGAMMHRWAESQFELWVPALEKLVPGRGHMPAEKFLRIVARVEAELPLDGEAAARIHASFRGQPAALYDIEAVTAQDGQLVVALSPDRTRCKAAERRLASVTGGCCGVGAEEAADAEGGGCCGASQKETAGAVCCA